MEEKDIWNKIEKSLEDSNCLKTNTAAGLVKNDEIISLGNNLCSPEGSNYDDKISDCPRMNTKTGSNYELCSPVHAEVMTCLNIKPNRELSEIKKYAGHLELSEATILAAFTEDELKQLDGSTLYLMGHYWACDNCKRFLDTVGVYDIKFDKITGEKTKDKYLDRKLA